ncbi:MAG: hypothetical protein SGARI_005992 [Bacillariaceae sp.]
MRLTSENGSRIGAAEEAREVEGHHDAEEILGGMVRFIDGFADTDDRAFEEPDGDEASFAEDKAVVNAISHQLFGLALLGVMRDEGGQDEDEEDAEENANNGGNTLTNEEVNEDD